MGPLHDIDLVHVCQQGGFKFLLTVHKYVCLRIGRHLSAAVRLLQGADVSTAEEHHTLIFRLRSHDRAHAQNHG